MCSYCCRLHKPSQYVRFYFTNKDINVPVEIKSKPKKYSLRNAGVKPNSPTVIFIPGFGEYGLGTSSRYIENAYVSAHKDFNILLLDWGDLSAFPWYPQASKHTKIVGQYVGKFLSFYHDVGELPISTIHIVGFSLGAHIAGFAGKYLFERGYEKIPRITGLDPALPNFLQERLTKNDARFVDIIHTDGGKFGIGFSIGHADFYPNGGSYVQPGCEVSALINRSNFEQIGYCGHLRAWKLYAESVQNHAAFPAIKARKMMDARGSDQQLKFLPDTVMGFSVDTEARGDYFLLTNGAAPFSKSSKEQESEMIGI
ncbi:hypothetical protein FQR65_LT01698 [Abscondita terminalis]|nr:hypothetical protein FQR65_LT01698 [Abscondita terminalis]